MHNILQGKELSVTGATKEVERNRSKDIFTYSASLSTPLSHIPLRRCRWGKSTLSNFITGLESMDDTKTISQRTDVRSSPRTQVYKQLELNRIQGKWGNEKKDTDILFALHSS